MLWEIAGLQCPGKVHRAAELAHLSEEDLDSLSKAGQSKFGSVDVLSYG